MERVEYERKADGRVVPRQNQKQFVLILGGLTVALLVFSALAYQVAHPQKPQITAQIMAAEVFVRAQLQPAPEDRLYFASKEEMDVKTVGKGRYVVTGWLDYISTEGRSQRFDFSCTVLQNPAGDWANEQLNLFPQS